MIFNVNLFLLLLFIFLIQWPVQPLILSSSMTNKNIEICVRTRLINFLSECLSDSPWGL